MLGVYPNYNDPNWVLWFKIAKNFYYRAIAVGVDGLNPPSRNDSTPVLMKKTAYYTARIT